MTLFELINKLLLNYIMFVIAVTRPRLPAPMLNQEDLMLARERRLKEIRMFR